MIIKGMTAQLTRTITTDETAERVRSGSLPVLATPVLSAAMEEAACKVLAPHLAEGETTVGGSISLIHKAPTLPGHTITVTATEDGISLTREFHFACTRGATGIHELRDRVKPSSGWYNLNGQPVASPRQGVYIRNGKKIMR